MQFGLPLLPLERVDTPLDTPLQSRPLLTAGALGADKVPQSHETDLSAERDQTQANPRLSRPHVDEERPQGAERTAGQGSQETVGLSRRMAGGLKA